VGKILELGEGGQGKKEAVGGASCLVLPDGTFLTSSSSATKLWRGEEELQAPPHLKGYRIQDRFSDGGLLWKKGSQLFWSPPAMDTLLPLDGADKCGRLVTVLSNGLVADVSRTLTFRRLGPGNVSFPRAHAASTKHPHALPLTHKQTSPRRVWGLSRPAYPGPTPSSTPASRATCPACARGCGHRRAKGGHRSWMRTAGRA
jgi:hypothetical protein